MHYRNGREAKNGDLVIQFHHNGSGALQVGRVKDATPGNDYCNGFIDPTMTSESLACLIDCLHVDDLAAILAQHGLATRPAGK